MCFSLPGLAILSQTCWMCQVILITICIIMHTQWCSEISPSSIHSVWADPAQRLLNAHVLLFMYAGIKILPFVNMIVKKAKAGFYYHCYHSCASHCLYAIWSTKQRLTSATHTACPQSKMLPTCQPKHKKAPGRFVTPEWWSKRSRACHNRQALLLF